MQVTENQNAPAEVNRPRSTRGINSGIELANTVLAIVKEVGEILNNVPYVKSLSGVILQIIRIRDEIKANKERCGQIIDKALRMSKWIYEKLHQIAQSSQREKLAGLEYYLNQHEGALNVVYIELKKHRSGRSLFSKLTNRGMDELNEHDRQLDELNSQLMLDIMFHNTIEQAASSSNQLASIDIAMRYSTLAESHMEKEEWPKAIESYTTALEAYKQTQNLRCQAEIGNRLTYLHIEHGSLVEAEKVGTEALAACKQANDAVPVGIAYDYLSRIYIYTNRITDAKQALEAALDIFKQENHLIGQLIAITHLGALYIQLDQLSMAEALLTALFKLELNAIDIPKIMTTLGWLYVCGDRLDKAESVLDDALKDFRKFDDKVWEAQVLAHLGNIYLKSNRLDEVKQVLEFTLDLIPSGSAQVQTLQVLGELNTIEERFENAEASLNAAMVICRTPQHPHPYQQGDILRSMGSLHMKRGHVDFAIEKFLEARKSHRQAQWISEQATDLKQLGEAYKIVGRIEEAVGVLMEAEALMQSVREARTLQPYI